MCEKETKKYRISFLLILISIVVVFLSVISWSNNQFIKSRTELVSALNDYMASAQEHLISSQNIYANHQAHVVDGLYDVVDSLSKQPIKSQKQMVAALRECITELKTLNFAVDNSELRAEFNLLKSDIEVSMEYLNSHVQLHIDKMNNTVSTFELWAAILTIIFLVFSFYSLYKVDELVKQGRDGVDSINKMNDECSKSVIDYRKELDEALKSNKEMLDTWLTGQHNLLMQQSDTMRSELEKQCSNSLELSQSAVQDLIKLKGQVESEKMEYAIKLKEMIDEASELLSKLRTSKKKKDSTKKV